MFYESKPRSNWFYDKYFKYYSDKNIKSEEHIFEALTQMKEIEITAIKDTKRPGGKLRNRGYTTSRKSGTTFPARPDQTI